MIKVMSRHHERLHNVSIWCWNSPQIAGRARFGRDQKL
jgi:hypothetical protein